MRLLSGAARAEIVIGQVAALLFGAARAEVMSGQVAARQQLPPNDLERDLPSLELRASADRCGLLLGAGTIGGTRPDLASRERAVAAADHWRPAPLMNRRPIAP